jgi:valyl-tRNA synthetase
VGPEKKVKLLVRLEPSFTRRRVFEENGEILRLLAGVGDFNLETMEAPSDGMTKRQGGAIGLVGRGFEVQVFIADAVDPKVLQAKFLKDVEKDKKFQNSLEGKLGNPNFIQNAPPQLVAEEQEKLAEVRSRISKLEAYIRDLA